MTLVGQIKECIENALDAGHRKFVIFPFGETGMWVKRVLNEVYGIEEAYILDNHLCKYNSEIRELSFLGGIDCSNYCLILACISEKIYDELRRDVKKYVQSENIAELPLMQEDNDITQIGKYSYGSLCRNHPYIEKIGAFCSFAQGVDVVQNHEMKYLTTHPMLYSGANMVNFREYTESQRRDWYFPGVKPQREKFEVRKRITIGNDVWLGRNVTITNYSNIGNGVIAGANAVITKDVPDYAVVVGAPARIIKYRYSPEEIESLNKIAWWNWSDEKIRERYNDFYLPVKEFIKKYLKTSECC